MRAERLQQQRALAHARARRRSSVTEPATSPPPSTRSSSATSVGELRRARGRRPRRSASGTLARAPTGAPRPARPRGAGRRRRSRPPSPTCRTRCSGRATWATRSRRSRIRRAVESNRRSGHARTVAARLRQLDAALLRTGSAGYISGRALGRRAAGDALGGRGGGCGRRADAARPGRTAPRAAPAPRRCRTSRRGPSRCRRSATRTVFTLPGRGVVASSSRRRAGAPPPRRAAPASSCTASCGLAAARGRGPAARRRAASARVVHDVDRRRAHVDDDAQRVARAEPAAVVRRASGSAGRRAGPRGRRCAGARSAWSTNGCDERDRLGAARRRAVHGEIVQPAARRSASGTVCASVARAAEPLRPRRRRA